MKKGDEMKGCPSNSGRRLYHFAQTIEGCQTTADRTLSTLTLTKPLLTHGLRSQARSSARASNNVSWIAYFSFKPDFLYHKEIEYVWSVTSDHSVAAY